MKAIPPTRHTSLGATAALAILAGVAWVPQVNAAAPGAYGTVVVTEIQSVGGSGYPNLGVFGPSVGGEASWQFDGSSPAVPSYSVAAELLSVKLSSLPGTPTVYAFCADYSKFINPLTTTFNYEAVPLSSIGYYSEAGAGGTGTKLPNAGGIAAGGIGTQKAALLQALANTSYNESLFTTAADKADRAAGFQLAVWKIVAEDIDPDPGLGTPPPLADKWKLNQSGTGANGAGTMGIFGNYPVLGDDEYPIVNGSVAYAESYLAAAIASYNADPTPDPTVTVSALTMQTTTDGSNYYNQDLLVFAPVPEPQTYALTAGLGLLGFGLYRRSRRQG